ncbi:MAG TPA: cytochrome c-type biogenesis protein CcmH [Acidobacteriota bacterium]|jgi:cytochrome c-type biogenesis protein CcmH
MRLRLLIAAVCFLLAGLPLKAQQRQVSKDEVVEITSNLVCQCGCGNKTVSVCGCGTADQVTKEVEKMLREGKTKDEIFAKYVNAEGVAVLATPPKRGFNLAAWLLPFSGILVAAIFLFAKARNWQRSTEKKEAALEKELSRQQESPSKDPYLERLNKELEKID